MALTKRGAVWWIDFVSPNGERIRESAETGDRRQPQELHDQLRSTPRRLRPQRGTSWSHPRHDRRISTAHHPPIGHQREDFDGDPGKNRRNSMILLVARGESNHRHADFQSVGPERVVERLAVSLLRVRECAVDIEYQRLEARGNDAARAELPTAKLTSRSCRARAPGCPCAAPSASRSWA
jgi:hypothetical protein